MWVVKLEGKWKVKIKTPQLIKQSQPCTNIKMEQVTTCENILGQNQLVPNHCLGGGYKKN